MSKWHEEDGVIYFSVTSDGTNGEEWIDRLKSNGFFVGDYAKQVLRSSNFTPTNGVKFKVAVLKGRFFKNDDCIVKKKIRAYASERKLIAPNAEIACLIREKFRDEEIKQLGLWYIIVMHKPINDYKGNPSLLGAYCYDGGRWIIAFDGSITIEWDCDGGFAFVQP